VRSQLTLFTFPSSHNSQKNKDLSIISWLQIFHSCNKSNIATAIGRSKEDHTFLTSDGAKFSTNFLFGNLISTLRNVALILSLDSLIAASGKPIISILGKDLLQSASTKISYQSNHTFAKVFVIHTIFKLITT